MALRDQPYIPLYTKDFISDEKLRACSASAVGVYIFLMCVLHRSRNYGSLELCKGFVITNPVTKEQQNNISVSDLIAAHADYLAKQLPFSYDTIARALQELLYYDVIRFEGETLYQPRMVKDGELSQKRATAGRRGMKARYDEEEEGEASESVCYNKTANKTLTNDITNTQQNTEYANEYENNIVSEEEKGTGKEETAGSTPTKKAKRFTPPTLEQVAAYCEERNNGINPQQFIDFYTANGWVQGKQEKPVKDWKACVRTWETNGIAPRNYGTGKAAAAPASEYGSLQAAPTEKKTRRSTL